MPYQLSGGEKQRAAIARSLVNSPRLLLADEPTGSLDWKTGETVFGVFKKLIRERGLTAIIATHNSQLAALTDSRYLLHGGRLQEDSVNVTSYSVTMTITSIVSLSLSSSLVTRHLKLLSRVDIDAEGRRRA